MHQLTNPFDGFSRSILIYSGILVLNLAGMLGGQKYASANDWSQFRGPNGDGVVSSKGLPLNWSETEHVAWKSAVPGRGWSSPVIEGNRIWITTAIEEPANEETLAEFRKNQKAKGNPISDKMSLAAAVLLRAVCIDAESGRVLQEVPIYRVEQPAGIHSLNSYASPSPVLSEGKLYCHFGTYGTACVDTQTAKVLWKTQLPNDHSVGPGSSPALSGNVLVIPCDGIDSQFVAGLSTSDGSLRWKTMRPKMNGDKGDFHKSFCTPLIVSVNGKTEAIVVGAQNIVSYEPATGKEIWKVFHGAGFSNVPRPIVGHGHVYFCTGFTKPELWAIKLGGQGDITDTHVTWKHTRTVPTMPSPVLAGDAIYMVTDTGVASCVDALTGKEVWTKRMGGNFSSSPLFADGRLYFSNRDGKTIVLKPGAEYKEIASSHLDGQILATPALLGNSFIMRTNTHLYRLVP